MSVVEENKSSSDATGPIRVMLVDDSAIIRGLLARVLEADPDITIVASAGNGEQALKAMTRHDVEVMVLDIEMPVMDGLTALPKILEINPKVKVIIASTLSQRNAQISLKALEAGATDYIPKPSSTGGISKGMDFQHELTGKVKALGMSYRGQSYRAATQQGGESVSRGNQKPSVPRPPAAAGSITLRKTLPKQTEILAIGSSTGGPQALLTLFRGFDADIQIPILITQHMPPTFTAILAEHISKVSGRECKEAVDGEAILPGRIYIAPGDWHMIVKVEGGDKFISLNQKPPINFCRPAVDPMFESIADAYGGRILAVVLTGMGQDGMVGGEKIVESGGCVIAQDEASSVVWGMPGAVAMAGICSAVLPLEKISKYISDFPRRPLQ